MSPDAAASRRHEDPRVAILVLNWNGWRDTIECLESLFRLDYGSYQVVLCDNGSTDGSCERIRDWAAGRLAASAPTDARLRALVDPPVAKPIRMVEFSHAEAEAHAADARTAELVVLRNATNDGFAGGTNVGLRFLYEQDAWEFVWILNNDIIVAPDSLRQLVSVAAQIKDFGAAGPTLFEYRAPDVVQVAGGGTFIPWKVFPRIAVSGTERMLGYVCGGCMLARLTVLRRIGTIDEGYFMYGEDVDFSLRISAAGLKLAYVPESRVWHKGGATTGYDNPKHDYYTVRNNLFLVEKYFPRMIPIALSYAIYRCVLPKIARGEWVRLGAVRRAIGDFRRGVTGRITEASTGDGG